MKHSILMKTVGRSAFTLVMLALIAAPASAQTYDLVADEFTQNGITMWGFAADITKCAVGGNICNGAEDCTAQVCSQGANPCADDTECVLADTCDFGGTGLCTLGGNVCTTDAECTVLDLCNTPDPADVCAAHECGAGGDWAVGPVLRATAGDTLTVSLRNCLADQVSLFVPGQSKALDPVFATDGAGRSRVQSFDYVTDGATAGVGGENSYTWTDLKSGSYIYQSGSDVRTQIPMGLYGALIVEAADGVAYADNPDTAFDETVAYDNEAILFFSEVDPAVNSVIPPAEAGPNYKPQHFMINGASFPSASPIWKFEPVLEGETVLLRFFNIGLDDSMPMVDGLTMTVLAEDGNLLPAASLPEPPSQHTLLLAAGKTFDAVIMGMPGGSYAIFDRSLRLDSGPGTVAEGGQMVYLDVNSAPVASGDAYSTDEDVPLNVAAAGVLTNDNDADGQGLTASLDTDVLNGSLILNADGSFTYSPNADFNGADGFSYVVNDGLQDGNVATVAITVNPVNDPPVAVDDSAETTAELAVVVDVVGNDSDVDGNLDPASVAITSAPTGGTLSPPAAGSVTYTPNTGFDGADSFEYQVCDTNALCDTATVSITVSPPA